MICAHSRRRAEGMHISLTHALTDLPESKRPGIWHDLTPSATVIAPVTSMVNSLRSLQ